MWKTRREAKELSCFHNQSGTIQIKIKKCFQWVPSYCCGWVDSFLSANGKVSGKTKMLNILMLWYKCNKEDWNKWP